MKHPGKLKRFWVMILTALMIMQQSTVCLFADETIQNVAQVQTETAGPEETVTPAAEPESEQPDQKEPEVSEIPEKTPEPEVSEIPEPDVSVTEVPAQEKTDTDTEEKEAEEEAETAGISENNSAVSANLNDFVTDVAFDNVNTDENGKLILSVGTEYGFSISFAEIPGQRQMDVTEDLVYTYPAQLTPAGENGIFNITAINEGKTYTVTGNTYTIEENRIVLRLNQSDPNFEHIKDASNVSFKVSLKAKVNENASGDKISFGDSVEKEISFNTDGSIEVTKTGSYDSKTGKFNYDVEVKSTGASRNVTVSDSISGTLLKYAYDLKAEPETGSVTSADEDGFLYTIPVMSDGQTVKLTYSADIDYSKLGSDSREFTVNETKNTVTAKGDNTNQATASWDFEHTTIANAMTKTGRAENVKDGRQTTTWTITVNPDTNQYVGGNTVTDTLAQNEKAPTGYSGEGLNVKIYDKNGTLVDTITPSWSELQSKTETGWTYKLPENASKTPYKYVISYTTETDVNNVLDDSVHIRNTATDGNGGTATGDVTAGVGGIFEVTKKHSNASFDGVDWTVDIKIPDTGFNKTFEITDTLPHTVKDGQHYTDEYLENSMQIKLGDKVLSGTDDYNLEVATAEKGGKIIKLTFKNVGTLFPKVTAGTNRVLTLTYKTKPDQDWPGLSALHQNTVKVNGDGTSKTASDSYTLIRHTAIKKVVETTEKDGLPVFKFDIILKGVDGEPVTVKDQFDTDLFEIYNGSDNKWIPKVGCGLWEYLASSGAATSGAKGNGGEVSYTTDSDGVTFTLSNLTKKNDNYWENYCIRYALKVKDAEALKKLKQMAVLDTDHKAYVENTATWDQSSSTVSCEYTTTPLSKEITEEPGSSNDYEASFRVVVNPDKLKLNGGHSIDVTDILGVTSGSNGKIKFLPDSLKVTLEPEGQYTADYSEDRSTLVLQVPDECTVTITYKAKLYGKGDVKYNNTVKISGEYSVETGEQGVNISSGAEGAAEIFAYTIYKKDAKTKEALKGAQFQLYDITDGKDTLLTLKDGTTPVIFTTDESGIARIRPTDETVSGWNIYENHRYKLVETVAPEGYEKASPITFTVVSSSSRDKSEIPEDGIFNGEEIYVYDVKAEARITARKEMIGKELEADEFSFVLTPDKDNPEEKNTVQTVTNDAEGNIVFSPLKYFRPGTYRYTVTEVKGKDETVTYDSSVYTVTVDVSQNQDEHGALNIESETIALDGEIKDTIQFTNRKTYNVPQGAVEVTKNLVYNNIALGAKDQTFYVALYEDETCKNRVTDVQEIVFKNTSASTVKFTGLEIGKKYYVSECTKDGTAETSGVLADGNVYMASFPNGNAVTVTQADGTETVYFANEFLTIPDGFYKEGKLTVTKKLLGPDGNVSDSKETFYAGIFDDEAHTTLSVHTSENVVTLNMNGSSTASSTVNVSVAKDSPTTLYIVETDKDGKPVADAEGFRYDVSYDKTTVIFDGSSMNADVTITNKEKNTESETTEETEETEEETEEIEEKKEDTPAITATATPTSAPSGTVTAGNAKTGDNTPVARYVILLLITAAVVVRIFFLRKCKVPHKK